MEFMNRWGLQGASFAAPHTFFAVAGATEASEELDDPKTAAKPAEKTLSCDRCTWVKIKFRNNLSPDPGQNRTKIIDLLRNMAIRTLPRTPQGEGGQEQTKKRH